jgi:hypothetical protein
MTASPSPPAHDPRNFSERSKRPQIVCAGYAILAALPALLWQASTVRFNYGGNWTALFCTGDRQKVPPQLAAGTYLFMLSRGYDGQFYRYVAHDPLLGKGLWRFVDNPSIRYRRILVPGLAFLFAGGRAGFIDAAYLGVILLFVFLGSYWLSRYAAFHACHPAWGIGFIFVPATLISLNRLTVDVALVALCAGFAWYTKTGSRARVCLVLALAALTRETGLLLVAAASLDALWNRRLRQAALFAVMSSPTLLWFAYVSARAASFAPASAPTVVPAWAFQYPVVGVVMKLFMPERYQYGPALNRMIQAVDVLALVGILLALGLVIWSLRRWRFNQETWAALVFAVLTFAVGIPNFWKDVNGYARPISPLLLFLGLRAFSGGPLWVLAPSALVDLRIGILLGSQVHGVLRGILLGSS